MTLSKVTHKINSQIISHLQYFSLSILMSLFSTPPLTALLGDSNLTEVTVPQ